MKTIKVKGKIRESGKIELETTGTIVSWNDLSLESISGIPLGSNVELSVSFDENEFISGKNGIVWATYDLRQAEVIKEALLSLKVNAVIQNRPSTIQTVYLLKVTDENDIRESIDFIWKSKSGLRLQPDWNYPKGGKNKSFEQWLSGY